MALSLSAGVTLSNLATQYVSLPDTGRFLLQAVIVLAVALSGVSFVLHKQGKSLTEIDVVLQELPKTFTLGLLVAVLIGIASWTPAFFVGWLELTQLRWNDFFIFLIVNTLVLVAYEAFPEEITLRGLGWSSLNNAWSTRWATTVTLVLFLFTAGTASTFTWLFSSLLGIEATAPTLFPGDPIIYVVQLSLFHIALTQARQIPMRGAVGIAIGFHLGQLSVVRILFNSLPWLNSGWDVAWHSEWALLLVLVHIILSALIFHLIARRLRNI